MLRVITLGVYACMGHCVETQYAEGHDDGGFLKLTWVIMEKDGMPSVLTLSVILFGAFKLSSVIVLSDTMYMVIMLNATIMLGVLLTCYYAEIIMLRVDM
jgi:hypothetical protein